MLSRRDFISLGSLLPARFLLSTVCYGGSSTASLPVSEPVLGLFFDGKDLPSLQRRFVQPMFTTLRTALEQYDRTALRRFITSEVRYNDQLYDLPKIAEGAQKMAFYYVMTGDEEAAVLSADCVRTLMKFPKWDYFLEAGTQVMGLQRAPESVMTVSLTVDWLGDTIEETERDEWLRTMGERGLEPCFVSLHGMRHPDRVVGWTMDETSTYFEHRPGDRVDLSNWPHILDGTNLKAVPASSLSIGTAAYRKRFDASADTERWMEQALYTMHTLPDLFTRDGSYSEGISYAGYTAINIALATTVLKRLTGTDLLDLLNWPGFITYLQEMSAPTTENAQTIINFGDAYGTPSSAVPFWVASQNRDRRAQWTGLAPELDRDHDTWSLLFYREEITPEPPPATPHLWKSDLDWIVARSGYKPEDLVVAMRSGGPANHEHADRNSIIVKAFGELLVADPYRAPYSYSDPSWMMRTTAGHNALLIDGQGHQYHDGREGTNASKATASIIRMIERKDYLAWTSDATPAYALVLPDVQAVTRTVVVLLDLPAVLIFDKVIKENTPSKLQARFFTYNMDGGGKIEAAGNTFLTFRPGATLRGFSHASGGTVVRSAMLPIAEQTAPLHPFAEVETIEPDLAPTLLMVLLPEPGTGGRNSTQITAPTRDVVDIILQGNRSSTRIRFYDTDRIPEFELIS